MPSRTTLDALLGAGIEADDHYNRFDALETSEDIAALNECLRRHHDHHGRPAVLTANFLVANPDFDRIRRSGFRDYCYESLAETYRNTPGCTHTLEAVHEGMTEGVVRPQLHGREHLNVPLWMSALQDRDADTIAAFRYGFWCHRTLNPKARTGYYLEALDHNTPAEAETGSRAVAEAAAWFERIFGFKSRTFIAPCYVWSPSLELTLARVGVEGIQGQRNQLIPAGRARRYRRRFHYTGQRNSLGQIYLVRNAAFEPTSDPDRDWFSTCLKEVSSAFAWRTPAIVSCHRVNFVGGLSRENRDRGLQLLGKLLGGILARWPEAEFLSSDELVTLLRARGRQ
jgi:hypothetical protein